MSAKQLLPVEYQLLKKLEKYYLCVKDLTYSLQLTEGQLQAVAQSLWLRGYLCPIGTSFLHILLPRFFAKYRLRNPLTPRIGLALTAKGYFYLNPLVVWYR